MADFEAAAALAIDTNFSAATGTLYNPASHDTSQLNAPDSGNKSSDPELDRCVDKETGTTKSRDPAVQRERAKAAAKCLRTLSK